MDTEITRHTITEHVAAFNSHDSARLLRGLHPEVVWATGKDVAKGDSLQPSSSTIGCGTWLHIWRSFASWSRAIPALRSAWST